MNRVTHMAFNRTSLRCEFINFLSSDSLNPDTKNLLRSASFSRSRALDNLLHRLGQVSVEDFGCFDHRVVAVSGHHDHFEGFH